MLQESKPVWCWMARQSLSPCAHCFGLFSHPSYHLRGLKKGTGTWEGADLRQPRVFPTGLCLQSFLRLPAKEFLSPLLSVLVFCLSQADPFWISADLRGTRGIQMQQIFCIMPLAPSLHSPSGAVPRVTCQSRAVSRPASISHATAWKPT